MHSHRSGWNAPPPRIVQFTSLIPGLMPPHRPADRLSITAQPRPGIRSRPCTRVRQPVEPRRG